MEIIKSLKMHKQPLVWKKAALKELPSCWTWKDVVFYPIHSILYKLNNNPSLLVDELIMGANPIINLLLLYKISKECVKDDTIKKVGLFFVNQNDYWAYDIIQNKDFFDEIYKIYKIKASNIEDLMIKILDGISREHLEIFIINDNNLRINYHIKDQYLDGWIFHLLSTDENDCSKIDSYIKVQNEIKNMLTSELLRLIHKNKLAKKIKWDEINEKNYPILMSKNISITSLPQGWINLESKEEEGLVSFISYIQDYCYGSAISIAMLPEKLKQNSLEQLR